MTRFSTEHVPAQLLREAPAPRSIVRMDLVQGTVVEKGYYGLRFDFDDRQTEDTVYVKGTALMHRVSS